MYWLKFNIYSILLSAIGITIATTAVCLVKILPLWLIIAGAIAALYCFRKAADIFRRYNYKVGVFNKLTAKLKNNYDLRYCLPYMDTACMRCVVYFALCEVGKRKDYHEAKRRKKDKCYQKISEIVSVKNENGHLKFIYKDLITGEYEEI